jgi:hypothetical protein
MIIIKILAAVVCAFSTGALFASDTVTIAPVGDGSFHNITDSNGRTSTVYTPEKGNAFGGNNAAGGGYQGTGVYTPTGSGYGNIQTPATGVPVVVPPR